MALTLRYVGGPTAVLELSGTRLLLDPTFDEPGRYPALGCYLTKLRGPALAPSDLGRLDGVLLSHHQHADNLDRAGRALLATVEVVLSTPRAARRLGPPVRGLHRWEATTVGNLRVTALPARHGWPGSGPLVGPVTGFLVEGPDGDRAYVSGDNASVAVVGRLAARVGPLTAVVLFAGAARPPYLPRLRLTLTADRAVRAAHALGSAPVALLHFEDWAHFTEGAGEVRAAFDSAGLGDRLVVPARGQTVAL